MLHKVSNSISAQNQMPTPSRPIESYLCVFGVHGRNIVAMLRVLWILSWLFCHSSRFEHTILHWIYEEEKSGAAMPCHSRPSPFFMILYSLLRPFFFLCVFLPFLFFLFLIGFCSPILIENWGLFQTTLTWWLLWTLSLKHSTWMPKKKFNFVLSMQNFPN